MSAALKLARSRPRFALSRRCMATAAAHPGTPPHSTATSSTAQAVVPLSNVEAQWEKLSSDEQLTVQQQLEDLQKKDWKTLSVDEKKAAYYVAFGPHGPRTPVHPPGAALKIFLGISVGIATAAGLFYGIRSLSPPAPRSMSKEWQEASNERAKEQNMNPISGVSSEGYKGKGFVQ